MLVTKRRKYTKGFSIDTGISDFHNLIGGVLKQHLPIPPRKVVMYRKLSSINYEQVNAELAAMNLELTTMLEVDVNSAFNKLQAVLITILDKHAPKRQKVIKVTDFQCMNKELKKAILKRNQYRNKFFKHRNIINLAQNRKHRNMVTLIKRKEIKKYFEEKCQLGTKNKDFWKTIKPIFSKTRTKSDNIPLREGNQIITNFMEVCNIFNTFFREIGSEI